MVARPRLRGRQLTGVLRSCLLQDDGKALDNGGKRSAAEARKSTVTVKMTGVWRIHALFVARTIC